MFFDYFEFTMQFIGSKEISYFRTIIRNGLDIGVIGPGQFICIDPKPPTFYSMPLSVMLLSGLKLLHSLVGYELAPAR